MWWCCVHFARNKYFYICFTLRYTVMWAILHNWSIAAILTDTWCHLLKKHRALLDPSCVARSLLPTLQLWREYEYVNAEYVDDEHVDDEYVDADKTLPPVDAAEHSPPIDAVESLQVGDFHNDIPLDNLEKENGNCSWNNTTPAIDSNLLDETQAAVIAIAPSNHVIPTEPPSFFMVTQQTVSRYGP